MFLMRIAILEKKKKQEEGFLFILFGVGIAKWLSLSSGSWFCGFKSPVLPLTSCVILEKLSNLSGLSITTCKMGIMISII